MMISINQFRKLKARILILKANFEKRKFRNLKTNIVVSKNGNFEIF